MSKRNKNDRMFVIKLAIGVLRMGRYDKFTDNQEVKTEKVDQKTVINNQEIITDISVDPKTDPHDPVPAGPNHDLWLHILTNAYNFDPEGDANKILYPRLKPIRTAGGDITKLNAWPWFKLLPGTIPPAEWAVIRKDWLDPVKDRLLKMLEASQLGK